VTAPTTRTVTDRSESVYERACQLIETELGGRRITTDPAEANDHRTNGARLTYLADDENTAVA
jgi:hypothetical protein